jgi:hypothetical protein
MMRNILHWLIRLLRPRLPDGERYVDETPDGELYLSMKRRCPSCDLKPPVWLEGPSGGACINVFCARCGQGYNITPLVQVAEKIYQDDNFILPEYGK